MRQEKPKDPKGMPFRDHHLFIYGKKGSPVANFWVFEEACRESVSLEKTLLKESFVARGANFGAKRQSSDNPFPPALFAQNKAV